MRKKTSFIFIFTFILLFCMLIVTFSDLFSSLITKQKSLFYVEKIEMQSYSVYAVSCYNYDNELEANNKCSYIKSKGAMGEVYKHGEYYVLASCFSKLIDAQEIRDNLIVLNYDAHIINIEVDKISIDYNGKNKALIENCLNSFRESFNLLLSFCFEFDKGNITIEKFRGEIAKMVTQNKNLLDQFITCKNKLSESSINLIATSMQSCIDKLEFLVVNSFQYLEFSSNVKNIMFEIIKINQHLSQNFV